MFVLAEILRRSRWAVVSLVLGLVLVVAAGVVGWAALRPAASVAGAPLPADQGTDPAPAAEALVFVSGAVARPGLYHLSASARVADALAAAGGMTPDADPGKLPDLAARVHDGRQVNVPYLRASRSASSIAATRLDINTASVDELRAVPGMPSGLPEAVVDARTTWGPFTNINQLRTLLDVDTTTLSALRPYLRVIIVAP
ncbi:MAG TPA: helix-hairpin-helix domain-containing protein [Candidatus Dormibacteraeota bacterium]|jgi:competence protein ComEA|nr:helix-hairpin-helix domain-containing protein [Candidatus Dormibacteraeota bacterium]